MPPVNEWLGAFGPTPGPLALPSHMGHLLGTPITIGLKGNYVNEPDGPRRAFVSRGLNSSVVLILTWPLRICIMLAAPTTSPAPSHRIGPSLSLLNLSACEQGTFGASTDNRLILKLHCTADPKRKPSRPVSLTSYVLAASLPNLKPTHRSSPINPKLIEMAGARTRSPAPAPISIYASEFLNPDRLAVSQASFKGPRNAPKRLAAEPWGVEKPRPKLTAPVPFVCRRNKGTWVNGQPEFHFEISSIPQHWLRKSNIRHPGPNLLLPPRRAFWTRLLNDHRIRPEKENLIANSLAAHHEKKKRFRSEFRSLDARNQQTLGERFSELSPEPCLVSPPFAAAAEHGGTSPEASASKLVTDIFVSEPPDHGTSSSKVLWIERYSGSEYQKQPRLKTL
ncbi:hypothetical protein SODALDRAFT_355870 [Sodiomyces alkalinus F11]|uniref:Uncharacterized protein n=1 Tax=Sodiomyces alkalinus (strain CBS 110278 / VKM F-3762 / F11) TaxID=1314773 RepID=A0A3N2QA75_SODAK|nr:hypothetical protein SODALDRAFT_355870 [Sodiomyces alkalinus F11]ROT43650.1 hypothetical protein SODALDRAFT_355870 [Sodiomyces alkalinus F11]